jgi:hypothetical protein
LPAIPARQRRGQRLAVDALAGRQGDRECTISLEQKARTDQRDADHPPLCVEADGVALRPHLAVGRGAWRADPEVEDVAARVVGDVVEEELADAHRRN